MEAVIVFFFSRNYFIGSICYWLQGILCLCCIWDLYKAAFENVVILKLWNHFLALQKFPDALIGIINTLASWKSYMPGQVKVMPLSFLFLWFFSVLFLGVTSLKLLDSHIIRNRVFRLQINNVTDISFTVTVATGTSKRKFLSSVKYVTCRFPLILWSGLIWRISTWTSIIAR